MGNSKTHRSHFWIGNGRWEKVEEYFAEIWNEDDPDRNHSPLSHFSQDQGTTWYDHDCLERITHEEAKPIAQLVEHMSYASHYLGKLIEKAQLTGLDSANIAVMFDLGERDCFPNARSVSNNYVELHYLGMLEYPVDVRENA